MVNTGSAVSAPGECATRDGWERDLSAKGKALVSKAGVSSAASTETEANEGAVRSAIRLTVASRLWSAFAGLRWRMAWVVSASRRRGHAGGHNARSDRLS